MVVRSADDIVCARCADTGLLYIIPAFQFHTFVECEIRKTRTFYSEGLLAPLAQPSSWRIPPTCEDLLLHPQLRTVCAVATKGVFIMGFSITRDTTFLSCKTTNIILVWWLHLSIKLRCLSALPVVLQPHLQLYSSRRRSEV
jgi:hypothetical protein